MPSAPSPNLEPDARIASFRGVPRTSPAFSIALPDPVPSFAAPRIWEPQWGQTHGLLPAANIRLVDDGRAVAVSLGLDAICERINAGFRRLWGRFGVTSPFSMKGPRHVLILSAVPMGTRPCRARFRRWAETRPRTKSLPKHSTTGKQRPYGANGKSVAQCWMPGPFGPHGRQWLILHGCATFAFRRFLHRLSLRLSSATKELAQNVPN